MLTIAYGTSRKEPMLEWFLDSLNLEMEGEIKGVQVVIVDYWANPFGGSPGEHEARREYVTSRVDAVNLAHDDFCWVAPKANPWQGVCRQTREDWFSAANARNTALCFAKGDWVAFVDDLSVLTPGWLDSVRVACTMPGNVTLGRYRKVRNLCVAGGQVVSFDDHEPGNDSRARHMEKSGQPLNRPTKCGPEWLFGCSLVVELERMLASNGWEETRTGGLGFEDCTTGFNLAKKGASFRYDPRMLTLESEERHEDGSRFKRSDYGESPNDKSHAVLNAVKTGDGWSPNDFFNGMTLRELRAHVMAGKRFPSPPAGYREWFTGELLSKLT